MTRVAVVVLNWNGIQDTLQCLDSLQELTYRTYDIVVVDNGSIDDSIAQMHTYINTQSTPIHLIKNSYNKGFAGGVNSGIAYALQHNYDAVALFNNDALADKKWLTKLVESLNSDPEIGIVTGCLLHADGQTIDSTGDFYSIWGMPFPRGRGEPTKTAPTSGYIFGASGGASLYKTSLFRKIGLFDERFFAYYEDVDISFRAQLAGYKVYYTDKAIAYHKQGASSKKISGFTVKQTFKNIPLLFIKNVPLRLLIPVGLRLFVLYVLIFGNAVKNGSGIPALQGWLLSIWHFWRSSVWQRFKIQSTKKVSSKYISSVIWRDLPPDQTGMRKLRKKFTGK